MRGEEGRGREREGGVVSCRARAVQLLGSISDTSLRSLASRADILRRGWSLRRTKPSSLQNGWEAPLHRYFTTAFRPRCLLFLFSPPLCCLCISMAYERAPLNVKGAAAAHCQHWCASSLVRHCEETHAIQTAAVEVQTVA